jgi:proline dehydrogenase
MNTPILLDAEYTNIQPAIDYMTYVAVFEFNTDGRPVVYVTMQAYLKDTPARLSLAMAEASRRNKFLALKLVRGAYIVRENELAASLGFSSPIHGSIEETHNCYNQCASRMLERTTSGSSAIVLATHNIDSGMHS